MRYNPQEIERKWQEYWEKEGIFQVDLKKSKKPYYNLMMFPYPSAEGLHVGNVYAFTGSDIHGRFRRFQGFNVFEPIGFDAFGIHSENFAIKKGIHPKVLVKKNTDNFRVQLKNLGCLFDWRHEVDTTKPDYYKWTQWLFLQLFKAGLAYRKKAPVDWCPSCKTVLADEQVIEGKCERCDSQVIQKETEQWFLKITNYAEKLLKNLEKIDWSERTKTAQRNWIGKSEGALIKFQISGQERQIEVFTTRPDTLFGCSYLVLAPEHPLIEELKSKVNNFEEVQKYIGESKKKTELEMTDLKEKTGVELRGVRVINPANNQEIPVFVADYVLGSYGTGAVMAVPSHDERDFEFAKKYGLPIKRVIEPCFVSTKGSDKVRQEFPFIEREAIMAIVKHWSEDKYIGLKWKKVDWQTFITGGPENGQTAEEGAIAEIIEETGYLHPKLVKKLERVHSKFFHVPKNLNRFAHFSVFYFELQDGECTEISCADRDNHETVWVSPEEMEKFLTPEAQLFSWKELYNGPQVYAGEGIMVDSSRFNGMDSEKAKWEITKFVKGKKTVNYHLRDWLISRQRYWGPPIPIIYCQKCGTVPVPEKDLPVELPHVENFRPKGTGESPLASIESFVNTRCPKCGGPAKRETDVSDTFLDSSWYFFRYPSSDLEEKPFDKGLVKKWLPVDMYIGGQEHAVLHLLYTRFITMALKDLNQIDFEEPFKKFRAHGLLTKEGAKMSKSKGNVVNPDEYYQKYGADTLRMYLMFIGPFSQGGDWQDKGIVGLARFLEKVWALPERAEAGIKNKKLDILTNKTIKKVTEDLEELHYNTAISAMMILGNEMTNEENLPIENLKQLIILLAPFAPYISEEIWQRLGQKGTIHNESWPKYDPKLIKEETISLVIQVNGRVRGIIEAKADITQSEAEELAISQEKIKNWIEGKKIKKVIFVPGKLINIVV